MTTGGKTSASKLPDQLSPLLDLQRKLWQRGDFDYFTIQQSTIFLYFGKKTLWISCKAVVEKLYISASTYHDRNGIYVVHYWYE